MLNWKQYWVPGTKLLTVVLTAISCLALPLPCCSHCCGVVL